MRPSSILAAALISASGAAIAQVASTPIEQKTPMQAPANASEDAPVADAADAPGNVAPAQTSSEAPANATPAAGDPAAATGQPPK